MTRICDLQPEDIKLGMIVRSLDKKRIGTIVKVTYPPEDRYQYAWVQWEGEQRAYGGFWENDCECEVVDIPQLGFII